MKRSGFVLMLFAVASWIPFGVQAQGNLHRLAAHFNSSGEASTDLGPAADAEGGILVYAETVSVPASDNVLYLTVTGVSDQHEGSELLLACRIGGAACRPEFSAEGESGWINIQRHRNYNLDYSSVSGYTGDGGGGAGDLHDNGFAYTWCARTTSGSTNVRLRMAAGLDDSGVADSRGSVFIENFSVYVDSNNISNAGKRCAEDPTVFPVPTGRH